MEGSQWGGGGVRMREKVEGINSINGRYKIDREPAVKGRKPGLKSTIWNKRKK